MLGPALNFFVQNFDASKLPALNFSLHRNMIAVKWKLNAWNEWLHLKDITTNLTFALCPRSSF